MRPDVDLAIVGSGFGGSILAMIARRLGRRVMLIERGRHPRFAIGESASPLAGILIEQLSDRYDLPALRPLSAHGTWCRTYPDVVCGLKRGFTYFKHQAGTPFRPDPDRGNQLLVAASPTDELSDTHWLRADVDHLLVRQAVDLGADYVDETTLDAIAWNPDGSATATGARHGARFQVRARGVLDASGPRGFLSRVLAIGDRGFGGYPGTQALFSHFTGVARCEDMPDYDMPGQPPYAVDAAALHHVFDEGWMWVLRFENGVTSAGVACTDTLARDLRLSDGAPAWQRLLQRYPSIAAQFADATPIREFTWISRVACRAEVAAGDGWAMLPSAAAFVDPLFSTGIPLTLLGVERLARGMESGAGTPFRVAAPPGYSEVTLAEADHTARFIGQCYEAFPRFDAFASYSMFYFAAASFSEVARRLDAPARPGRFLCADHETFGPATLRLAPAGAGPGYADTVAAAIDPLNIAGLCDRARRNWYGVDVADTVRAAHKLRVHPDAVRALFAAVR